MSQEIDKTKPVYARFKVVNGVPHYVLCVDPLVDTHVFSFELNDWTDKVTMSNVYIHLETLLVKAFAAGFKQVIEVRAAQTIDDKIMYLIKKYTEENSIQNPVYLFADDNKKLKWRFWGFWFKTQSEALIAVNNLFPFAEVEPTEKSTETKVSPPKVKTKVKKVRPPSEIRKLEKEIIETVKKKRLASIALAEGNSDPYLRKQHANDVKTHEQTLKTLKARFPKWALTWER